MKTADELTTLTLDFLAEHTNEAAAAVVLGVFWHLIWERPKHLQKLAEENVEPFEQEGAAKRDTQLRGNLKKELHHVLTQNEELEKMVQELQFKLEEIDLSQSDKFNYSPTQTYVPISVQHSARKRGRNGGMIRAAIGLTTNEIDTLGSCWALLVFGFCLIVKRKTRKRYNPLSTTVVTLDKASRVANERFQAEVLPALIKIWIYLSTEFLKHHARITDPETNSGKAIAVIQEILRTHTGSTFRTAERVFNDKILPVSTRLTQQGVEYGNRAVKAIGAMEMFQSKEQPPTILLAEHEETIADLEDSLDEKETSLKEKEDRCKALEEKVANFEKALKGKEILLYEERMKTRSAKLEAEKVRVEREETRRKESRDTEALARAAVAEDQRRILCNFLSQHIQSRQQQDYIQRVVEKSGPKKSAIVLPDPILQGFASAMYLNNISDLSSQPSEQRNEAVNGDNSGMDCRDDACNEEEQYGNQNESRLLNIREQYMRLKTAVGSLRPSQVTARDGYKGSTGSLLWGAANEATEAKDCTTKKLQLTRAAASQEPSSWMEDPASWRMNQNEVELRE